MTAEHVQARAGAYADSVRLMQVSARAQALPGVRSALVAMATELNLGLLARLGLAAPPGVTQHDLLVAVRADDEQSLATALALIDDALGARSAGAGGSGTGFASGPAGADAGQAPLTTRSAIRRGGRGLALISVPGHYVLAEAMDALEAGCDVMIFSDNVPVEHEIVLKDTAGRRGLLVMGPDCGTAIVGGVGLGFANAVAPGPVGLVAASGTGAQQVSCLLDFAGVGCGAVLGVGGRDLSAAVAGRSARAALATLDADPAIELIMLLSKPPDPGVAAGLRRYAATLSTPVLFALTGPGQPDLTAATEAALASIGAPVPDWPAWGAGALKAEIRPGRPGGLRGLFAGGTLCEEAMVIATQLVGATCSNVAAAAELRLDPLDPLPPIGRRPRDARPVMIDFGADELTAGRPHPMIDQRLRLDRLAAEAADPATAVILLDVLLGYGSHPDPAAELAPAIKSAIAGGSGPRVVVSLIGTAADPQNLGVTASALTEAGARVFASHAQAVRFACGLIGQEVSPARSRPRRPPGDRRPGPGRPADAMSGLPHRPPPVISAGLSLLADAVTQQSAQVTVVDWAPPRPGTAADLATVLADPRRAEANERAVARMLASRAYLVDVVQASQALGLERGQFLHAGPPVDPDRVSGPLRGALLGAAIFEGILAAPGGPVPAGAELDGIDLRRIEPCHGRGAVGPMAGVVSPSMWMFVLEDPADGRRAYCSLNEGLGQVLRYGAYSTEVIGRLSWMTRVLGPLLRAAVRRHGPVDVTSILAQMVQMGDEAHNRNRAGTLMLLRDLLPDLVESGFASSGFTAADVAEAARFIGGNDHFFLNLAMPACKLALDAARDVPGSTMVVAMARNGADFGIQVSGTGSRWFTAPALVPEGLFLPGYGPDDASPDIGDSAITETAGLGGFAMAAAPAIVRLVGGSAATALAATARMAEITLAEHPLFGVPALDFRGTPAGIDVTLVVRTGVLPQINTGMAGRVPGTGQVGAGLVTPPAEVFPAALAELARLTGPAPG
jgi:succinyl-CoA synthetase alpha subunit